MLNTSRCLVDRQTDGQIDRRTDRQTDLSQLLLSLWFIVFESEVRDDLFLWFLWDFIVEVHKHGEYLPSLSHCNGHKEHFIIAKNKLHIQPQYL